MKEIWFMFNVVLTMIMTVVAFTMFSVNIPNLDAPFIGILASISGIGHFIAAMRELM